MQADGGPCAPGYDGANSMSDHFGFGMRSTPPDGMSTGPILTADWIGIPEGEGTCYSPTLTCPAGASGLGGRDEFYITSPCPGCFFGGSLAGLNCGPHSSETERQFYLRLYTDCSLSCDPCPAVRYCSPALANSTGDAGSLRVDQCSLSSEVTFTASRLPTGVFGYLLVGDGSGVIVSPPGSVGILCLGGSRIGRYAKDVANSGSEGAIATALIGGATGGGSGDLPSTLGGTLQPGQTWNFQLWHRDGGTSNFTDASTVLLQP